MLGQIEIKLLLNLWVYFVVISPPLYLVLSSYKVTDCWLKIIFCNRNLQADLNQAIAMISYYASSSEPAQVRGKTVYLQYSNRQEIVNNKTAADVPGNVLLVTIEGADARLVSIDVLHLVSDCLCVLVIC